MKIKIYIQLIILLFSGKFTYSQSCVASYLYSKQFQIVTFSNQSFAENLRFYWNFGDGTSTNFKDPIHEYAESGNYLVTLYVRDTVSNCSNYSETWINVLKNSIDPCVPRVADSIFSIGNSDYVKLVDSSFNCMTYSKLYTTLGNNGSSINTFVLPKIPGNWISSIKYGNSQIQRASYKTLPWKYDRSKNYTNCSANFEFRVISQDANGQKFFLSAMNKNAANYEWIITGFGNPIIVNTDTTSVYYSGDPYSEYPNIPRNIYLRTIDPSGCRDSTWQSIVVRTNSITVSGIDKNTASQYKIELFPNPSSNEFNLFIDTYTNSKFNFIVFDILGREVLTGKHDAAYGRNSVKVSLKDSPKGLYILKIFANFKMIYSQKLIKD